MADYEQSLPVSVLDTFPTVDEAAVDKLLLAEIERDPHKIVVLDDDPTGVQTVHDVSVYTDWSEESIREGFLEKNKVFYVLTNSRGMSQDETAAAHADIARVIARISRETGIPYLVISRSDSTLRGHYPLETETLRRGMEADGQSLDGEVLCPFFEEGGRLTIGGTHYVRQGDTLVPAAQTEFARDPTFGYSHSHLPEYVEEKTEGSYRAEDVTVIGLPELRACDYDGIEEKIEQVSDYGKVCVDATCYADVKVFCVSLFRAMAKGRRFMFRSAAGLVKVMGGISNKPLLTRGEMVTLDSAAGGVVVVGSHTAKTTAQLEELLTLEDTVPIEFDSDTVLAGDEALLREVDRCVALEEQAIAAGRTAVCYTRRTLLSLPDDTKEEALRRSVRISDGVQRLVGQLSVTPAFIVAKGGITSSDVGTKALGVRRATVLGQIRPGIPVWQTGPESRFPKTPYVIFPGNTGGVTTLREAVETLVGRK